MKVDLAPGKYVVAVSGGVDSVVLLDVLAKLPGVKLVVAHFDHGMRPESGQDREFVQELAAKYGVPFVYEEGALGATASEATARTARYDFLCRAQQAHGAQAIVTAHHQDDVLETMVINLLRGTGRKGLSSMQSTPDIQRPLLHIPKQTIVAYAQKHGLTWREDATNADTKFLRNHIRHNILQRFDKTARRKLLDIHEHMRTVNAEIDELLARYTHETLERHMFIMLPHNVSKELLAAWLRTRRATFDKKALERMTIAAKTYAPGKCIDVDAQYIIRVERKVLALTRRDR